MPAFDAFILHSAVVDVSGEAFAFAARSGTGKSTHLMLWKAYLDDKMTVINGDKPIMRFIDGKLYAYGTPWCGKEGWNRDACAPIHGISFVERALENRIEIMPSQEAASRIMNQILIPKDALGAINTLEMVDKMLNTVNCWVLGCNISIEAAEIAYNAMSGGQNEN